MFSIGEQTTDTAPEAAILVASGELDYTASPAMRRQASEHIAAGRRHLVFDLSEVTFLDSTAIGELVGAFMRAQQAGGGSVRVVCSSENARVLRIFNIAGVASLITLHRSREQALLALSSSPHTPVGAELTHARAAAIEELGLASPTQSAAAEAARRYAQHAAQACAAAPEREEEQTSAGREAPRHLDELA